MSIAGGPTRDPDEPVMVAPPMDWPSIRELCAFEWRFLTFRATGEELRSLHGWHLLFGLALALIAGVGRWWDLPGAAPLMAAGIGSVFYVVALGTFLFVVTVLFDQTTRFVGVLAFLALTAPPAFIYALPVEMWFEPRVAATINYGFLVLVAVWRLALLIYFVSFAVQARPLAKLVIVGLPLAAIIHGLVLLGMLNLALSIMGGVRELSPQELLVREILHTVRYLSGAICALLVVLGAWVIYRRCQAS